MKTNRNNRIRELRPWYRLYHVDNGGWTKQQAKVFIPHSKRYNIAHVVIEVPFRMPLKRPDLRVKIAENNSTRLRLLPGRYIFTVSLLDRTEGTTVDFCASYGLSSDTEKPSLRVKKVYYSTGRLARSHSIRRWLPSDHLLRYRAIKASRPTDVAKIFAHDNLRIDCSSNGLNGSTIDINPEMSKYRGCASRFTTQPLRNLRNTEKGGAFLIASGPSINEVDFNLLRDRVLFGVNGSAALLQKYPINFAHYMVIDAIFAIGSFPLVVEAITSGAQCFFSHDVLTLICAMRPDLLERRNIHLVQTMERSHEELANDSDFLLGKADKGFSKNLEKGYFPGGSVAMTAMQACYYLGYDRVNLLGVDFTAERNRYRFYEKENNTGLTKAEVDRLEKDFDNVIVPAFQPLRMLMDAPKENFRVFNLSAKSRIPTEIVPKITLEEALRREGA